MGFFDMLAGKAANQLGNVAKQAVNNAVAKSSNKTEKIVFQSMPMSYEEFTSLSQAKMETPFETASFKSLPSFVNSPFTLS